MPYKNLSDLPERVKNVLPKHAQEIYQTVFNRVWTQFQGAEKTEDNLKKEESAHKIAWAAVKKKYKKIDGKWVEK